MVMIRIMDAVSGSQGRRTDGRYRGMGRAFLLCGLVLALGAPAVQAAYTDPYTYPEPSSNTLPSVNLTNTTVPTTGGSLGGQTSGEIFGAIYTRSIIIPAGSGVIHSFLRFNDGADATNDVVQGYNTDDNSLAGNKVQAGYDMIPGQNLPHTFTHSVWLNGGTSGDGKVLDAVPIVTIDGVKYRSFVFDINETGDTGSLLSLDKVELYLSNSNVLNNRTEVGGIGSFGADAVKVYDMDTDLWGAGGTNLNNWVALDSKLNGVDSPKTNNDPAGSGDIDMTLLVPDEYFTNALRSLGKDDAYLYLYSRVGEEGVAQTGNGSNALPPNWVPNWENDDGYQEWAFYPTKNNGNGGGGGGGNPVPEPGTLLLLGSGLLGLGGMARRRGQR